MYADVSELGDVAPARERGLKFQTYKAICLVCLVAPARERGLKYYIMRGYILLHFCRSREGAWIEM